jgi:hypothetical protein
VAVVFALVTWADDHYQLRCADVQAQDTPGSAERNDESLISVTGQMRSPALAPTQAGLLNTDHLLHQTLTLIQSNMPEYLQLFIVPMETWLALER